MKSNLCWSTAFVLIALLSSTAQARVFSFKSNWVAAHLIGTGGTTQQSGEAYEGNSGADTKFTDTVKYDFSGEFGFTFLFNERVAMRIGAEGVQSKAITAQGNSYATSTNYMSVASQATVFNPNLTFELALVNSATSRIFGFFGAGYATAKVNNTYNLTTAGTTAYSGSIASFGDSWTGTAISGTAGLGTEFFVFDNVTFSVIAGYRYMQFKTLTYATAGSVFYNGSYQAVTVGETVNDSLSRPVHLDMSGYFAGLILRFYIPPLN